MPASTQATSTSVSATFTTFLILREREPRRHKIAVRSRLIDNFVLIQLVTKLTFDFLFSANISLNLFIKHLAFPRHATETRKNQ